MARRSKSRVLIACACVALLIVALATAAGLSWRGAGEGAVRAQMGWPSPSGASGPVADEHAEADEGAGSGDGDGVPEQGQEEPPAALATPGGPGGPAAAPFVIPEGVRYEPDVVLVQLREGTSEQEVMDLLVGSATLGERTIGADELASGLLELPVAEGSSVEDAVRELQAAAPVAAAQPNYLYYALLGDEGDLRETLGAEAAPTAPGAEEPPAGEGAPAPDGPGEEGGSGDEGAAGGASADQGDARPTPTDQPDDVADPELTDQADPLEADPSPTGDGAADLLDALASSDPYVGEQWALASMRVFEAWALATCDGRVGVAVLDQYPDVAHEDLAPNVVASHDTSSQAAPATEAAAHGTSVTGVVGAVTDNGLGVAGVSHNAGVIAVNVFNGSAPGASASSSSLNSAYGYLMEQASPLNIRVANLSLGVAAPGPAPADDVLIAAITRAYDDHGIVTVAAAGNASTAAVPYLEYPGDADKVVSVINLMRGSGGAAPSKSPSSNYNVGGQRAKNISAPGTNIMSTAPGDAYDIWSGTSMAAPQVAGVLALEFAANPALGADEVVAILYATATDLGPAGFDEEYGWGEVDAYEAVLAAVTGEYDDVSGSLAAPLPTVEGATRVPVGATATYAVSGGEIRIKSGDAATLQGSTLAALSAGSVELVAVDATGEERFTLQVELYDTSGCWTLGSAVNPSFVLDISGGSLANGGNAQLYPGNGSRAQAWLLEPQPDGGFVLRCAKTGKALDVSGGSTASGANVQQHGPNGTPAQRWRMTVDKDDLVTLVNVKSGQALDVAGGTVASGANVQQYRPNGTLAQRWELVRSAVTPGPVWDGIYRLSTRVNTGFALDVAGGSLAQGANVQLYRANGSDAQKWKIEWVSGGSYRISSLKSGKVLDAAGGRYANGVNIRQWSWGNNAAQLWQLSPAPGGFVISRGPSGWVLDVAGGTAANGRNVQQYRANGSAAQTWLLHQY